jgi:hypothetical protein
MVRLGFTENFDWPAVMRPGQRYVEGFARVDTDYPCECLRELFREFVLRTGLMSQIDELRHDSAYYWIFRIVEENGQSLHGALTREEVDEVIALLSQCKRLQRFSVREKLANAYAEPKTPARLVRWDGVRLDTFEPWNGMLNPPGVIAE